MTSLGKFLFWCIFAIISLIFIRLSVDELKRGRRFKFVADIFCSFCVAFFMDFILLCLFYILSCGPLLPDQSSRTITPIYSIGTSTGIEMNGAFILGCGVIDGKSHPTYRYFTFENGRYRLCEVNAKNFDVVCTDDVKPQIVIDATRKKAKIVRFKYIFDENKTAPPPHKIHEEDQTGTIYIPKNSIIQSYKLQL